MTEARSAAPMFFAEYGADAYDGRIGPRTRPTRRTSPLADQRDLRQRGEQRHGRLLGRTIFEWNDEW